MNAKHTPTPKLYVTGSEVGGPMIVSDHETCARWPENGPKDHAEVERARFIVLAVNSHAALVESLEKILEGFEHGIFVRSTNGDHDPKWGIKLLPYLAALGKAQEIIAARAAIAKATAV